MSKFGDLIRGVKAAPAPTPEPVVEAPVPTPEPVVEAPALEDMNKKELRHMAELWVLNSIDAIRKRTLLRNSKKQKVSEPLT